MNKVKENDKLAVIARDGSRMANCGNGITKPIYVGGIYQAKRRKKDSVLTWRRVGSVGPTGTYLSERYLGEVRQAAESIGLVWVDDYIRHGTTVRDS